MLRKLRPRSIYDVMAAIGCFAALATGSAYAADTVFSSDIVDGEVKSVDVGDNEIKSADVKDQSLTTFDVSTFLGVDVVDGTLTGDDIGDEQLTGLDVAPNSIYGADIFEGTMFFDNGLGSSDICDFCNNDQDVGQGTFVDFQATIGDVAAQSCKDLNITGINAQGDHLLLTPSNADSDTNLIYDARYRGTEAATLHVCNPTTSLKQDGTTHFNLLVFDAQ
jgi:hypothetical protein